MNPSNEGDIEVLRGEAAVNQGLPAARDLVLQAAAVGRTAVIVTATTESRKIMAKRRHDLKGALRTLGYAVQALRSGYTFQDDVGPAKVEAISKAVDVLNREAELLARIFPD